MARHPIIIRAGEAGLSDEITCLIADDHEVVREGLRLSLSRAPQIRVVGEASDGASAIAVAERRRPNVVIMDVRMPGTSSPSSRQTPGLMPSQSLFANRSSTDLAPVLVAGAVLSAIVGALGLALGMDTLAAVGVVAGATFAGAFSIYLIASERKRHAVAEDSLQAQASHLEALVAENARLLEEAHEREGERARLTDQVITAEQDERRRLSLFLHDGPLQSMSGIALMHDAALESLRRGRYEDAERVIERSLARERKTIQELRDLSFAIEPLVLRDQGFHAAVRALGDQIEQSDRITVSTNVGAGEALGEKTQAA